MNSLTPDPIDIDNWYRCWFCDEPVIVNEGDWENNLVPYVVFFDEEGNKRSPAVCMDCGIKSILEGN